MTLLNQREANVSNDSAPIPPQLPAINPTVPARVARPGLQSFLQQFRGSRLYKREMSSIDKYRRNRPIS
jgi:hypothetical protein